MARRGNTLRVKEPWHLSCCTGRHIMGEDTTDEDSCQDSRCRNQDYCLATCKGCPCLSERVLCEGDHWASTCGNGRCQGKRVCDYDCPGCPDRRKSALLVKKDLAICQGNHKFGSLDPRTEPFSAGCQEPQCKGRKRCVEGCVSCPWLGRDAQLVCLGNHSSRECGGAECVGERFCPSSCAGCPDRQLQRQPPLAVCDGRHFCQSTTSTTTAGGAAVDQRYSKCQDWRCYGGRRRCAATCKSCPCLPKEVRRYCKGNHTVGGCNNDGCRGRTFCLPTCTTCPDKVRQEEKYRLLAVPNLPTCRGGHPVGECQDSRCYGRKYCAQTCQGCPDLGVDRVYCLGWHTSDTCGNARCLGRTYCTWDCKGCPDKQRQLKEQRRRRGLPLEGTDTSRTNTTATRSTSSTAGASSSSAFDAILIYAEKFVKGVERDRLRHSLTAEVQTTCASLKLQLNCMQNLTESQRIKRDNLIEMLRRLETPSSEVPSTATRRQKRGREDEDGGVDDGGSPTRQSRVEIKVEEEEVEEEEGRAREEQTDESSLHKSQSVISAQQMEEQNELASCSICCEKYEGEGHLAPMMCPKCGNSICKSCSVAMRKKCPLCNKTRVTFVPNRSMAALAEKVGLPSSQKENK